MRLLLTCAMLLGCAKLSREMQAYIGTSILCNHMQAVLPTKSSGILYKQGQLYCLQRVLPAAAAMRQRDCARFHSQLRPQHNFSAAAAPAHVCSPTCTSATNHQQQGSP